MSPRLPIRVYHLPVFEKFSDVPLKTISDNFQQKIELCSTKAASRETAVQREVKKIFLS